MERDRGIEHLNELILETDIAIKQCQQANERLDKILSGEDESGIVVGISSSNQDNNKDKPMKN